MRTLRVDFSESPGRTKPVNAVNNGPAGSRVRMTGNFKDYQNLEIPYARLHDSAFNAGNYGGEYSVDVHRIFPSFDADENDPASYLFSPTDSYLQDIESVGTKIYYRLGASIEHGYKKGTYPPKDYLKWARICEHIIMHYTEGWADGFKMDIEYWEIWNEYDCQNPDGSNPCWQGTDEEFYDFYSTVSKYLKSKFPSLKIGGPAICSRDEERNRAFLKSVKEKGGVLDFFSYHWYGHTPEEFRNYIRYMNGILSEIGFSGIETHLNEYNYIREWTGEVYNYSMRTIKDHKGASFIASLMSVASEEKLDMLMYYDARPSGFNGIFASFGEVFKTYYTFLAAKEVIKNKNALKVESDSGTYAMASTQNTESAMMLTFFEDDETTAPDTLKVSVTGAKNGEATIATVYKLNRELDLEPIREEIFTSSDFSLYLKAENYDVYMIKFKEYK